MKRHCRWICPLCSVIVGIVIGVVIGPNFRVSGAAGDAGLRDSSVDEHSLSTHDNKEPFPSDWVSYNNTHIYYSEEKMNWTSSKKYCETWGAVLAVLEDETLMENVIRFKKFSDDHWCGRYRDGDQWKWLKKTSVEDVQLDHISGRHCGTWNPAELLEADCSSAKHFICTA